MSSEAEPKLIFVVEERPLPKFYVFYDEWTGDIISITNKVRKSKHPYLHTDDKTAIDIMMGVLDPKKYIVIDSVDGKYIGKKDDALRIKEAEEVLSKVPVISNTLDADINIIMYQADYRIEVNISQDTIYKLTGKRFNKKFSNEDNVNKSKLVLYLIKKNNPFYLLEVIEIDPVELANNGYVLFDVSNLQNIITLDNVDVLTKRIFKNYGIKYKTHYVTVDYHTRKSNRRVFSKITDTKNWATFSVAVHNDGWIIKSNFSDPIEQKIYKDLNIYLTSDNPSALIDKIQIPLENIGWEKQFLIETKVDPRECHILMGEEGKYVTFKFEDFKQNV